MLLSPGLPWVRIGLVAILSLAIGAAGFETGRRWVLADWNAERQEQTATALANAQKDLKLKDRQYERKYVLDKRTGRAPLSCDGSASSVLGITHSAF